MRVSDMDEGCWYDVHTQMQDGEVVKQRVENLATGDDEMTEGKMTAEGAGLRIYTGDGGLSVSFGPSYAFEPQPDITAYELARCMTYVFTHLSRGLEDEPESVRRHWQRVVGT